MHDRQSCRKVATSRDLYRAAAQQNRRHPRRLEQQLLRHPARRTSKRGKDVLAGIAQANRLRGRAGSPACAARSRQRRRYSPLTGGVRHHSSRGIIPVVAIDGITIGTGKPGARDAGAARTLRRLGQRSFGRPVKRSAE